MRIGGIEEYYTNSVIILVDALLQKMQIRT